MKTEMNKTWSCTYWVTFGMGDGSDSIDLDVPVTDAEYEILENLRKAQDGEEFEDEESEELFDGKYVSDFPELSDFESRVSAMADDAASEDMSYTDEDEYIDNGGYRVSYSYGAVE